MRWYHKAIGAASAVAVAGSLYLALETPASMRQKPSIQQQVESPQDAMLENVIKREIQKDASIPPMKMVGTPLNHTSIKNAIEPEGVAYNRLPTYAEVTIEEQENALAKYGLLKDEFVQRHKGAIQHRVGNHIKNHVGRTLVVLDGPPLYFWESIPSLREKHHADYVYVTCETTSQRRPRNEINEAFTAKLRTLTQGKSIQRYFTQITASRNEPNLLLHMDCYHNRKFNSTIRAVIQEGSFENVLYLRVMGKQHELEQNPPDFVQDTKIPITLRSLDLPFSTRPDADLYQIPFDNPW
ncbi:TPA: hypothetical protein HA278_03755 [Candidatus Woesearchaeota archaeon]|nr:hypothetical protein [archaeon]HIJ11144.1 hypothetical protein [Candidatus Woesearchaeota archaeon]|tara:strand:+ start:82 stop:972 length:891 start_codon:yes stop_codon:yes gene_type:complete